MKTLIITLSLILGSCVSPTSMLDSQVGAIERMAKFKRDNPEKITCTKPGVFALGYSDGSSAYKMKPDKISTCQEADSLSQSYIDGYRAGVQDNKKNTSNVFVATGKTPKKECIKNFTDEICGYDCKKVHTNAGCASNPSGNCVTSPWDVTCGINCSIDTWNKVTCDQVTYTSEK